MSTTPPPPQAVPDPSATLSSVLHRLGHRCPDECPADDPALGAVWFAWHSRQLVSSLVVVDTDAGADPLSVHRLLRRVNGCTRAHQIRVLARHPGDRGRALAAVAPRTRVSA